MTDLEKIELAIRRAAAQMPNHASRQFRLVADELIALEGLDALSNALLLGYRKEQSES